MPNRGGGKEVRGKWAREYLPEVMFRPLGLLPVLWIPQGNFFETHFIPPLGGTNVEVTADGDFHGVIKMPIFGGMGAAPNSKSRDPGNEDEIPS